MGVQSLLLGISGRECLSFVEADSFPIPLGGWKSVGCMVWMLGALSKMRTHLGGGSQPLPFVSKKVLMKDTESTLCGEWASLCLALVLFARLDVLRLLF